MKSVLVVAAHPDDEVLGCGGAIAHFAEIGVTVCTLILGEGITSRGGISDQDKQRAVAELAEQSRKANFLLGVEEVYFKNFPDNRFDSAAFLDIVKAVEQLKEELKPDAIFTHFEGDLNIDHQLTYRAVITAARPILGETVREVYSFETVSSTEWRFPNAFSPDTFFDISGTIERKLAALQEYKSELRRFPHPRSLEGVKIVAQYRGMQSGLHFAEAFKCVRRILV